jgi:predicted Fe-S protein YdhL (DUF1289 family)
MPIMVPPKSAFVFDPNDPRAPSEEAWERMSPDERAQVVAMLPAEVPLAAEARANAAEARADAAEADKQRLAARVTELLAELERLRR